MYFLIKRIFDITVSFVGIIILLPVFLLIAIIIKCTSKGPVFFRQIRMGKDFKQFKILKFRTMIDNKNEEGPEISSSDDIRITVFGKFLRKYKLDELPQLVNVIGGNMSIVGPRPEVPKYVEIFKKDYEEILSLKPGITDIASLKFRKENELLTGKQDIEAVYINNILPEKIQYNKIYLKKCSFTFDLLIILKTIFTIII
ncbi:MAG: sugar transferase [Spirochaetes bacterium]|nr:sugar transferase [Spirochaetota bacterium]